MKTFAEFWPFYLSEHRHPLNRALHFAGSTLGVAIVLLAVWRGAWPFIPVGVASGYAFAWFGHFVVEKNRPASFQHPLWSFLGDWKMYGLMLSGRLPAELARLSPGEPRSI